MHKHSRRVEASKARTNSNPRKYCQKIDRSLHHRNCTRIFYRVHHGQSLRNSRRSLLEALSTYHRLSSNLRRNVCMNVKKKQGKTYYLSIKWKYWTYTGHRPVMFHNTNKIHVQQKCMHANDCIRFTLHNPLQFMPSKAKVERVYAEQDQILASWTPCQSFSTHRHFSDQQANDQHMHWEKKHVTERSQKYPGYCSKKNAQRSKVNWYAELNNIYKATGVHSSSIWGAREYLDSPCEESDAATHRWFDSLSCPCPDQRRPEDSSHATQDWKTGAAGHSFPSGIFFLRPSANNTNFAEAGEHGVENSVCTWKYVRTQTSA
jgi:hypothetical protein